MKTIVPSAQIPEAAMFNIYWSILLIVSMLAILFLCAAKQTYKNKSDWWLSMYISATGLIVAIAGLLI